MPQPLSNKLQALQIRVEQAARARGLDFFEIVYEVLDWEEINEVAAYGGYPARYPHWRFGMEYVELTRSYQYGLSKIYEMVINNDPTYAYLLAANHFVDQKLVMAHVCGHADFFKHNFMFAATNRRMVDEMANHAARIRRYVEAHGVEEVEGFLDRCLSIDNLVDPDGPPVRRPPPPADEDADAEAAARAPSRLQAKGYMDPFINPPAALEAERARRAAAEDARERRFPERPERDVMAFLMEHAPLRNWERDVLGMVREEALYFLPQGRTKIMNEGWASYWHSRLMTEELLDGSEVLDYAANHAGVMSGGGALNPYKLGIELWRDIEERWNRGRHGPAWEACDDWHARQAWDTGEGRGMEKVFEVRRHHNDVTFIDTFLTPEFVRRHGLFTYEWDPGARQYVISDRSFAAVKEKLLFMLTNFGQPRVDVADANHLNRGELVLAHRYEGVPLRMDYARDVLENVQRLWKRPVNLETCVDDEPSVLRFDGSHHSREAAVADRLAV